MSYVPVPVHDRRWIVLCVAVALALAFLWGCTPRGNFDGWIARQGYTVKHEPVPCAVFPRNCGGVGQTDIVNHIIYLDDAVIARMQAQQNLRDPSIDVATYTYYHEWSHVADVAAGFVEGIGDLQFEHAAQCGAELVLGRTFDFFTPGIYWDCNDAEARQNTLDLDRQRDHLMDIRPINGWGEGKPIHECESCDADTRGRTLHLVTLPSDPGYDDSPNSPGYVCDRCYANLTRRS